MPVYPTKEGMLNWWQTLKPGFEKTSGFACPIAVFVPQCGVPR